MLPLLLWLTFMASATFVTFVVAPSEAEAITRKRIREVRIRAVDPDTVEEERLAEPFVRRVLVPLIEALVARLEKMTPTGVAAKLSRRLRRAGQPLTAGRFLLIKASAALLGGLAATGIVTISAAGTAMWKSLWIPVWVGVLGWTLPEFWLSRLATQRRTQLARALPDVLDLLSVSVEAGLGFDGAVQKVSEKFSDPTAAEFGSYLREIRLGKTREAALRNLAERTELPDLKSFAAAVVQADRLGVSLSRVLRIQSEQLRTRRMQRAEEAAMQTPVKMVFPLVLFIFPAIFVVLLGPAVIHVLLTFTAG